MWGGLEGGEGNDANYILISKNKKLFLFSDLFLYAILNDSWNFYNMYFDHIHLLFSLDLL